MHGPTFMANPLACAVALASLELLARRTAGARGWRAIERGLRDGPRAGARAAGVRDVRVLGAIGVVSSSATVDVAARDRRRRVERGVWLRPFRDLIYTMPPYVIGDEDLAAVTGAMVAAARVGAEVGG